MSPLYLIIGVVAAQRLGELVYARNNERRLIARGGHEIGRRHYPLFILLHGAWLLAMLVMISPTHKPHWSVIGIMAGLQLLRLWVVVTLGPYWTTRVITLPDAPLVRRGPYRLLRHPNYAVVVAEIAVLPLAFDAYAIAVVFTVLNTLLLGWRIRVEEQALAARRSL